MQQLENGDVRLNSAEVKSLSKLITRCHNRVSSLVNDGDWLGWEQYRALQMWNETLQGHTDLVLADFVDGRTTATTVQEWLEAYGLQKEARGK